MPSGKCSDGILYGNIGRLVSVNGVFVAQGSHLSADFGEVGFVFGISQYIGNQVRQYASVGFVKAASGHGGGTDADAGGNERFFRIVRDGVFC